MAHFSFCPTMNTDDDQFCEELGARIAQARKAYGLRQQALADQPGVPQQTLAHYGVGRTRFPASMLPTLARLLTMSLDELMGHAVAPAKRGNPRPTSRLHQQIDAVEQLPEAKQQFVSQMLDTVLAKAAP
jgi:transcriptional regulator with XRE-family HTH domain